MAPAISCLRSVPALAAKIERLAIIPYSTAITPQAMTSIKSIVHPPRNVAETILICSSLARIRLKYKNQVQPSKTTWTMPECRTKGNMKMTVIFR